MNGSSDNWLTTFDYDGTSFFSATCKSISAQTAIGGCV